DHVKLLFSQWATLFCRGCGREVKEVSPADVFEQLLDRGDHNSPYLFCFSLIVPPSFSNDEIIKAIQKQGFTRVVMEDRILEIPELSRPFPAEFHVLVDRIKISNSHRSRVIEAVETAYQFGHGTVFVHCISHEGLFIFSNKSHCPYCNISYDHPLQNLFSFNDPLGACPDCHGFGRIIEIDPNLVVPDHELSLSDGAIRPWRSGISRECQEDLLAFCKQYGISVDIPFCELTLEQHTAIMQGTKSFYGVNGYFNWLESKSYKMHVRVLLSRYRAYRQCETCGGQRFRNETLLYRFREKNIAEIYAMSVETAHSFFNDAIEASGPADQALNILLSETLSRLSYLQQVGLGYLTLDRQSRTLSGGETERVALTAALGTRLVNTLYVLDEPSTGLHPRDIDRLGKVLLELKNRGNTVLLVEHDMSLIRLADHVIDLGPGPGPAGGYVMSCGSPKNLINAAGSLTADYLSGEKQITVRSRSRKINQNRYLTVKSPTKHNLKGEDIRFPLKAAVCVTGVSGSGKSTLLVDVLHSALERKLKGGPASAEGGGGWVEGAEQINQINLVDQRPIAKTPRSNPGTYMKILPPLRRLFSGTPTARQRGLKPGHFSCNSILGKCPSCKGAGYDRIEMQFLPDVLIRCPVCDGKRLKKDVLDIRYKGFNISGIFDLSVKEIMELFNNHKAVIDRCIPLVEVGLDYLKLGQPLPTLSGGEAQRLKLARSLAQFPRSKESSSDREAGMLFLFDEPTVGLHPHDISTLLSSFDYLIDSGHSVMIIEHHLDVIRWADYIIDLGPEGGENGGYVVVSGSPEKIASTPYSWTGKYLNMYLNGTGSVREKILLKESSDKFSGTKNQQIEIHGASEHNLNDITISVPRDNLVTITGVSGSGKSSLAFDILFTEGRRRYMESLPLYVRRYVEDLNRPQVTAVHGIPPTVAIEQRTSRAAGNSTIGTITEIYHYLRLLFSRTGKQTCLRCKKEAVRQTAEEIAGFLVSRLSPGESVQLVSPLISARKGYHEDIVNWAKKNEYTSLIVDGIRVEIDDFPRLERYKLHTIELPVGEILHNSRSHVSSHIVDLVTKAFSIGGGTAFVLRSDGTRMTLSKQLSCPECGLGFEPPDPRLFSFNSTLGACPDCHGSGLNISGLKNCSTCLGTRLRPEALAVSFDGFTIVEMTAMTIRNAFIYFTSMDRKIGGDITTSIIPEILSRLTFLEEVGLPYLTLDRRAKSLSTGEQQRVKLAAQLGSNLQGVCYILDEPTVGLHSRDSAKLIEILHTLRDRGNSIVVVEHDEAAIRAADHLIDLGPGAGTNGGNVIIEGSIDEITQSVDSVTGHFLKHPIKHKNKVRRQIKPDTPLLTINGARKNNLKGLNVSFPLNTFICITGVSGAGKSTLIGEILVPSLKHLLQGNQESLRFCESIDNWNHLLRVGEVDQSPIGRTPRSVPATYIKVFNEIRSIFSSLPEARARGYTASRFSFNTSMGNCPTCRGLGSVKVKMSFLPDVYAVCKTCAGRRYEPETLEVKYRGKTVADVLTMTVSEALGLFNNLYRVVRGLKTLEDL
ncbi:MAG: excinuclease ABC subunit UvrA, partial [bacterium]|nr:excinuclease ABC subunit UvrA [bacterium]